MSTATTRKQGDTAPALVITCLDGSTPVDLTTASQVRLVGVRSDEVVIDDDTLSGTVAGVVTYPLAEADTAATGRLYLEIEVTWPDGTIQTFPGEGYLTLDVLPDLG